MKFRLSHLPRVVVLALVASLAGAAVSAVVSEDDAKRAADAFVGSDSIGSLVLNGRTVSGVVQRGHLWIATLSPSGHVVLSGGDLVDPIVGFSKNDFVEPDPESPAFAVLEGADASVSAAEAQDEGTRHARWTKLLGGGSAKSGLLSADNPSSAAVVVEPFLVEHYDQWQPYNDYAPMHQSDESKFVSGYEPYRGRCPCGCVATAAAQIFHHFEWPARIDNAISHNHVFTNPDGVDKNFPIRFDAHVPICWNAISNEYAYTYRKGNKICYDLRGGVAETVRYPIARLILWCDVMANMHFEPAESGGSGAIYDTVASGVSDCYTSGHWVEVSENADYSQVVSDLQAGIPLQVGLAGHEVVAHGWADNGTSKYIYINYGWSGNNDGYYNMDNSTIDLDIQEIYVGHYPRAKPQLDPLPAVSGTSLTLNWHFPAFYTNNLSGFAVSVSRMATTTSTFLDDFSASEGSSSSSDIYVAASGSENLLYSDYAAYGIYSYPKSFTLTSASVLTFKVASYAAPSSTLEVQARFDGGSWQTISSPDLNDGFGDDNWTVNRVYLGDHGGESVQFRIVRGWGGEYYVEAGNRVDYGYVLLDDVKVTDVLAQLPPETRSVGNTARSCTITGLDAGSTCTFTVTPVVSGALVQGEASEPVTTSIEGERRTPVPGEQSYSIQDLVFSTADTSGTWSYSGTASSSITIKDYWDGSVSAKLQGALSEQSVLSFSWKANNDYSHVSGVFSAVFTDSDGVSTTLWTVNNNSAVTTLQSVSLPLGAYAGKTGVITISFSFSSNDNTSYGQGVISYAKVTNVQVPSVPAVAWDAETITALGTPEILSVSEVSEDFYGECWTNTTTFSVVCSETVETLEARPSHLSLVGDNDVSVSEVSNGTFKVCVTPSGINESNFRSRMILTLVAADANGTKCYKDLSLRFSQVEPRPTEVHVAATTSDGATYDVVVPYAWIAQYGLAPSDGDAAAYEAAVSASADADSDGLPNWAEYVCGTSPTDPAERLEAFITMEDGKPVVTYTPSDSQIAAGFKAVIKGTTDLAAAMSTWEVVTETRTSTCRFFRVEIVPEN